MLSCVHCPKTFHAVLSLRKHYLQVHKINEEPMYCSECDKEFANKAKFTNHKLMHSFGITMPLKCHIIADHLYGT